MNELDKRKVEELKAINGNFTDALMRMWELHNREVQELRKLYNDALRKIAELETMLKGEGNGTRSD